MKVLRFVLILAFMFTLCIHPAQAKAGERYGFVPLLTKLDSTRPLVIQARRAFEEMLPKLLAAKKNGEILDFEPELSAGILKIKYAANALPFSKVDEFDNINTAVALVPQPESVDAQPEVLVPVFKLGLHADCFTASGLPSSAKVVASLKDTTDRMVSNYAGKASLSGTLNGCFDWGSENTVSPGYEITYNIYNPSGVTLLGTYITTAPIMGFTSVNKTTSVVSGTGTAGQPYTVTAAHLNLNAANTVSYRSGSGVIATNRTWSTDLGTAALRGGDDLLLEIKQSTNFIFDYHLSVPYAYCQLGGNYCSIHTFPFQPVLVTIVHAGVTHKFTGKTDGSGLFGVTLEDAYGNPIMLVKTDRISGTNIPAYRLSNLTAVPNYNTNYAYGIAPPNKYFEVSGYDNYTKVSSVKWAHSFTTAAYYSVSFAPFDMKTANPLALKVYYINPVSGNVTALYSSYAP